MHDLLRWWGSTWSSDCPQLWRGGSGLAEGEAKEQRDLKCCAPSTCGRARSEWGMGAAWLAGRVCGAPAAAPSHSGGWFSLEERLFTIKFYLQVKGMMHPILNHCFSPEGLYYLERECVRTQKSTHASLLSVIRALNPERLEAEGAQREGRRRLGTWTGGPPSGQ